VIVWKGPTGSLADRQLLGEPVERFGRDAIARVKAPRGWTIELPDDLLFDRAGLALLSRAVAEYGGSAARLELAIVPDADARRDHYSLQEGFHGDALPLGAIAEQVAVRRPVAGSARRRLPSGSGERGEAISRGGGPAERLAIPLPARRWPLDLPISLAPARNVSVPRALLVPARGPFDPLFANQIAIFSALERRARTSPLAWLRALAPRAPGAGLAQRIGLAANRIERGADVHPTAVIEGSTIGSGARIGALCTVRYSVIGPDARLHDGAKVEYSVVGRGSWLMHDLVLSRSVTEEEVFLIHGPYQFSLFQRRSAAFATILMDWRPQGPILALSESGVRPYGGAFLGSVIGEEAKLLGGTLLAPGRVVPPGVWLAPDPASIHAVSAAGLPPGSALTPAETARVSARRGTG
jgi:hypothetical protein